MYKPASANAPINQNDKLKSLQTFAAGTAHDLNNKLAILVGNLDLTEMDIPTNSPSMDSIAELRNACDQLQTLAQNLTEFATPTEPHFVQIDVNEVAREAVETHGKTSISLDLNAAPCLICWNRQALASILDALISNAAWAANGSAIEIATRAIDEDNIQCYFGVLPAGSYIELIVRDAGCGISEECKKFMFDPYFSACNIKRRGLGLASVPSLLQTIEGGVAIESGEEEGTTVHLFLPAVTIKE